MGDPRGGCLRSRPLAKLNEAPRASPGARGVSRLRPPPDARASSGASPPTGASLYGLGVISKFFAVALLPVYTRHLTKSDYGAAEVLLATVVALSIFFRLGIIEALLRFYYEREDERTLDRNEVVALLRGLPA